MKFLKDILLNIISQSIFVIIQQFILFPKFESIIGSYNFGQFLVLYAIVNIIAITVSASFTNLFEKNYNFIKTSVESEKYFYFYFRKLLVILMVIFFPLVILGIILTFNIYISLSVFLLASVMACRLYILVKFRIKQEFKNIMFINLLLGFLYIFIYLFDSLNILNILILFSVCELIILILLIFILRINITLILNSSINEKIGIDILYLIISGFSNSITNYLDRFIISLLIGPSSVTLFYIITMPSKLLLFPINMASSVVMSYLSNFENLTNKVKRLVLFATPLLLIVISLSSYIFGIHIINLIYSSYNNVFGTIYILSTITFSLICIDSLLRSFIIKFYETRLKMNLDIFTLLCFLILSFILVFFNRSLVSIAISQLISYTFKNLIQIYLFYKIKTSPRKEI